MTTTYRRGRCPTCKRFLPGYQDTVRKAQVAEDQQKVVRLTNYLCKDKRWSYRKLADRMREIDPAVAYSSASIGHWVTGVRKPVKPKRILAVLSRIVEES